MNMSSRRFAEQQYMNTPRIRIYTLSSMCRLHLFIFFAFFSPLRSLSSAPVCISSMFPSAIKPQVIAFCGRTCSPHRPVVCFDYVLSHSLTSRLTLALCASATRAATRLTRVSLTHPKELWVETGRRPYCHSLWLWLQLDGSSRGQR